MVGLIIGTIEFTVMWWILVYFFEGVHVQYTVAILCITLVQILTYNLLFRIKRVRKVLILIVFNIILGLSFYLSLPQYTYNQSKEMVVDKYSIEINSFVNFEHRYENIVPVLRKGIFDMKTTSGFYYFMFNKKSGQEMYVIVNPQSGEIIEIDKPGY